MKAIEAKSQTDSLVHAESAPDMSEIYSAIESAIRAKKYMIHLRDTGSVAQRSQIAKLYQDGYTIRFKPGWCNPLVSVVIPDMIEVSWLYPKKS